MTTKEINNLRRRAKEICKITKEKYMKCLHELAKINGYKNWQELINNNIDE